LMRLRILFSAEMLAFSFPQLLQILPKSVPTRIN
jgi:hypothetical protein